MSERTQKDQLSNVNWISLVGDFFGEDEPILTCAFFLGKVNPATREYGISDNSGEAHA